MTMTAISLVPSVGLGLSRFLGLAEVVVEAHNLLAEVAVVARKLLAEVAAVANTSVAGAAVVAHNLLAEVAALANSLVAGAVARKLLAEVAAVANSWLAEVGVVANTQHGAHMIHVRVRSVYLRMWSLAARNLVQDSMVDFAVIDKGNCTLKGALSMAVVRRVQIAVEILPLSVHMKLTWPFSLTQL